MRMRPLPPRTSSPVTSSLQSGRIPEDSRCYGATLTPFEGANYSTQVGEMKRQAVNRWIRTGRAYDGVIDFDAATRDPGHVSQVHSHSMTAAITCTRMMPATERWRRRSICLCSRRGGLSRVGRRLVWRLSPLSFERGI